MISFLIVQGLLVNFQVSRFHIRKKADLLSASLKTYKFLLDTQAGLTNLTNGVNNLNGTGLEPLNALVTQIQPVLLNLENTIDQFGADFSVQNVVNQASEWVFTQYLQRVRKLIKSTYILVFKRYYL